MRGLRTPEAHGVRHSTMTKLPGSSHQYRREPEAWLVERTEPALRDRGAALVDALLEALLHVAAGAAVGALLACIFMVIGVLRLVVALFLGVQVWARRSPPPSLLRWWVRRRRSCRWVGVASWQTSDRTVFPFRTGSGHRFRSIRLWGEWITSQLGRGHLDRIRSLLAYLRNCRRLCCSRSVATSPA